MTVPPSDLRGWLDPTILAAGGLAVAAGFGQFGVVVLLGDLAVAFGEAVPTNGVTAEVGMAGTTLGIGLAIIRLASLGSLPAAAIADRLGRRRLLIGAALLGLALTAASAGAPTWWWFVALFALGRPLLAATTAVAGVVAAEETSSRDRSKAIALIGAAFAVGTGLFAIVRAGAEPLLGFRGILLLVVVPMLLVPLAGRWLEEPARFERLRGGRSPSDAGVRRRLPLGRVRRDLIPRLATLCSIHVGIGFVSGPVNSYLFLYGERMLGISPAGMSLLLVSSGLTGLGGLLVGRWGADRLGRRITAGAALVGIAVLATAAYSGARPALLLAYPLTVLAASALTPSIGALDAELFPTSMRATAAGWITASQILGAVSGLVAFGALVEAFDAFAPAALLVAIPVVLLAALLTRLPETRGLELEESAPERP